MRTPALQTQRLRDQILAALREADAPLSTRAIAARLRGPALPYPRRVGGPCRRDDHRRPAGGGL